MNLRFLLVLSIAAFTSFTYLHAGKDFVGFGEAPESECELAQVVISCDSTCADTCRITDGRVVCDEECECEREGQCAGGNVNLITPPIPPRVTSTPHQTYTIIIGQPKRAKLLEF